MDSSPIDEIKNRLDLVEVVKEYIKLQKSGVNYRALCPFHSEKTPSFFVSPSRQIWHCFGSCSEGGDIFKFIMKIEGVEFGDALRILAAKAGIELKRQDPRVKTERQRAYEISEWATRFFEKQLQENVGKKAKEYLLKRGISNESIQEWRIGYSVDEWDSLINFLSGKGYSQEEVEKAGLAVKKEGANRFYDRFRGRIIFPVFDFSSQPIGFGGRIFDPSGNRDKEAKYLNTPNTIIYDKSKVLYGLNKARNDIRKNDFSVLVEGYTDVIMSCQAGVKNVVATSGTALTAYQLEVLKRYSSNIITAFDMDIAGDSATKRGIEMAQAKDFNIKVALMPEGLDPADLVAKDSKRWKEVIKNSLSIISFYFETAFSRFNCDKPEDKKKIAEMVLPVINKIASNIEKDFWVQELAKKLKVKDSAVIEDLNKLKGESDNYTKEEVKQVKKKSRNAMLEERILMLLIQNKEICEKIDSFDLSFLSQDTCDIIIDIQKEGIDSPKVKERIGHLDLKESDLDSIDLEEEINNCLSEIKGLKIREKLNEISTKIKEAEDKSNFDEAENFKKEFDKYCKKLADIS